MKLTFDVEDINYLLLSYEENGVSLEPLKVAFKEAFENNIVAACPLQDAIDIAISQEVELSIVFKSGLCKIRTIVTEIEESGEFVYYTLSNINAIEYLHKRKYPRVQVKYDCIYTIETDKAAESHCAVTYDLSVCGVSILVEENVISVKDVSLVIMTKGHEIKSTAKCIRSELFDNGYKLYFEFTELSKSDYNYIESFCLNSQVGTEFN